MADYRVWLPELPDEMAAELVRLLAQVWAEGWARGHEDRIEMEKVPELDVSENPYIFRKSES